MEINYESLKIPSTVNILEKQSIKIDRAIVDENFEAIHKYCDKSISEFKSYDFHKDIANWLADSNGLGLALYSTKGGVNVGLGKSLFVSKVLPVMLLNFHKPNKFTYYFNCADFNMKDFEKVMEFDGRIILIIDEFGREPLVLKDYGTIIKPMERIFEKASRQGWTIVLATNFTKEEVAKHYNSDHLIDRLRSMCFSIECSGTSNRKKAELI